MPCRLRLLRGFLRPLHRLLRGGSGQVRRHRHEAPVPHAGGFAVRDRGGRPGQGGSVARGDLPRIAARHSKKDLDIRPGLYDTWLECLIATVRTQDPQFSAEVETAWRETLAFGITYMRERY